MRPEGLAFVPSILARKIGRAVFYILARNTVFSMEKFMAAQRDRAWTSQTFSFIAVFVNPIH